MAINSVNCQFLSPQSARFLEAYGSLKTLMMSHCDMRNLDNFPRLPLLVDLDLSHNSLQGSFNNLMILTNLEYLNISNNFVSDVSRLQPLRKLEKIVVCVKDNPFLAKDGWKIKLKQYGVKLAKDPKPM